MQNVDLAIYPQYVIPVIPRGTVLENHIVVVHGRTIIDIVPHDVMAQKYRAKVNIHRPGHILMPGLINSHTHSPMSLMRGLADDLPLMTWLHEHIWPAEATWVSPKFVQDGSRLAIAEMIRGGTTCFNDMYFFPDETAKVAIASGMRAVVGLIVIDFPSVWAKDSDEYIHKGLELYEQLHHTGLVTTAFAPHGPYTVSDDAFRKVITYSEELSLPIHVHLHETKDEIAHSLEHHKSRPIARLHELGVLTPRTLAVHMTQLQQNEIELFATTHGHVVHCPESNLKLASGFTPVTDLSQQNVNIALGTDGAASNNDLDMFGEMRTAALLAKGVSNSAASIPAEQALEMATINAAKALGLADTIGSIEIGKAADLITVDMNCLESQPLYHPISQLIYATGRNQVNDVWINGQQLLNHRQLTKLDEEEIIANAKEWQQKLRQNS